MTGRTGTATAAEVSGISDQLWNSGQDAARDGLASGQFGHFTVPATGDGLVSVGDQKTFDVYGRISD